MRPDEFSDEELCEALANCSEVSMVDLDTLVISPSVLNIVPAHLAIKYRIVPVTFEHNTLCLAMADLENVNALDDLRFILNVETAGAIASEQQISKALRSFYGAE
jgi:type IV pilus assembly protein PilB